MTVPADPSQALTSGHPSREDGRFAGRERGGMLWPM
jgi:hypothetical protein